MDETRLFIGIDGGGTSSRLLASDGSGRRWSSESDAANPRIVGIERASLVASSLVDSAIAAFPDCRSANICAGVAGAATASMQRALADSIKLDIKSAVPIAIRLTDDATIAHEAAFKGKPGTLFVVGTGSMILVRSRDGTFLRSGGWGYLLGDEGSGYSIGRAGLRAVSASIDANEATMLTTRAAAELEVRTREELLEKVYASGYSMAAFAKAVLDEADKGDEQSIRIVEYEIRKLVDRFVTLTSRPDFDVPASLKASGGLSDSRGYMLTLAAVVRDCFPDWEIAKSGRAPVEGAHWMAKNAMER